jgi:hypothetical protein
MHAPNNMFPSPVKTRRGPSEQRPRHCVIDVPPDLFNALLALAEDEELPIKTLVVLLINSALSQRIARRARGRV